MLRNLTSLHCLLDTFRSSPQSRRCEPGRPTSLRNATSSAWILGHWRDAGAARTGELTYYVRYEPRLRQRPNADLRLVKLKRLKEKSHSPTTSCRDCLFSPPHPSDLRPPSTCLARPARMYLPIPRRTAQPADGSAQLSQATRHLHTLVRRDGMGGGVIGAVCFQDEYIYWGLKSFTNARNAVTDHHRRRRCNHCGCCPRTFHQAEKKVQKGQIRTCSGTRYERSSQLPRHQRHGYIEDWTSWTI